MHLRSPKLHFILLVIIGSLNQIRSQSQTESVFTGEGGYVGKILQSRNSRNYFSFRGIQYGTQKRFEVAEPLPESTEMLDALEFGAECPHVAVGDVAQVETSENCLYLNVYVPQISGGDSLLRKKDKENAALLLPVMLWVHGGGYMDGAGSQMSADFFMDEDVILVTINYRLGALGFLNTQDGVIPSNLGLKDQVLALKWVQKYISSFGGDPEKVTIFGESAGSGSVHLLMLSPAAKGLFRGVIAQSGTGLSPWSVSANPRHRANLLAKRLNCPTESSVELADCLRKTDLDSLLKAQRNISHENPDATDITFSPSIESDEPGFLKQKSDFILLPTSPFQLLVNKSYDNSRDLPLILGGNEIEGLLVSAINVLLKPERLDSINKDWLEQTKKTLFYGAYVPEEKLNEFAKEFRTLYYGNDSITIDNKDIFIRLHCDLNFDRSIRVAANLHSETNSQVYPYIIKFPGEFSIVNLMGFPTMGVSHADELQYLFPSLMEPQNWPDLKPNSSEEKFSKKLVSLWASFAINGKPSTSWVNSWPPVPLSRPGSELKKISWLNFVTEPVLVEEAEEDWTRINALDILFSQYEQPQVSRRGGGEFAYCSTRDCEL